MQKISELKTDNLVYNHLIYDKEAERRFAMHSHSFVELIYVVKGEVAYTIEDRKFVARQGELIMLKPHAYHFFTIQNQQDYEKIGILFHQELIDITDVVREYFIILQCRNGRIRDILNKLEFYYHNCPEPVFTELLLSLTKEIVINVRHFSQQYTASPADPIHPQVERAIEYIHENLTSLNTIQELASHLAVSESHIKALFRDHLHVTPKKYITEKKLLLARSMITNGTSPTQVALHCGYSNYVTFYRLYLKYFGTKPADDYQQNKG